LLRAFHSKTHNEDFVTHFEITALSNIIIIRYFPRIAHLKPLSESLLSLTMISQTQKKHFKIESLIFRVRLNHSNIYIFYINDDKNNLGKKAK
jgi:hypothetical protein